MRDARGSVEVAEEHLAVEWECHHLDTLNAAMYAMFMYEFWVVTHHI